MDLDAALIKNNPFFKTLNESDFKILIEHVSILTLKPDQVLFHEGDFSDNFFIIKKGSICITTINARQETVVLALIGDGGFFGEQAFSSATSPRRRAKATAKTETLLYQFQRDCLLSLKWQAEFKPLLEKYDSHYIREKLKRLVKSLQIFSYPLKDILENENSFEKRAVLFYQNTYASHIYIVVSGEVELRMYNQQKQLQQIVSIGPGQMFGAEALEKNAVYQSTAVVKINTRAILIDSKSYLEMIEIEPILKNLSQDFNNQFTYKAKGKIIQFRSDYLDKPAITSIITLKDGREIICQKIINENIFVASVTNINDTHEIKDWKSDKLYRILTLKDKMLVGVVDVGDWVNSYLILDLIINRKHFTEEEIKEFIATGHITDTQKRAEDQSLVCKCMRVPYDVINNLILMKKAQFSDISQQTGAGTICGGCRPTILEMLGNSAWITCSISRVIEHNDSVRSFQLKPINNIVAPYEAGQFLIIKAKINNVWVQRNYTLTSDEAEPYYEITVKKEPKGLFSTWLFAQDIKHIVIYVAGPYGHFTLKSIKNEPIVCFMGGIGITPAIAFLRKISRLAPRQVYIDYSVRDAQQFILNDEFSMLASQHHDIIINHRITNIHGILTEEEIQKIVSSFTGCHVFVCGPKGLEKIVIETIHKMPIQPERLHVEEFIHAGASDIKTELITY